MLEGETSNAITDAEADADGEGDTDGEGDAMDARHQPLAEAPPGMATSQLIAPTGACPLRAAVPHVPGSLAGVEPPEDVYTCTVQAQPCPGTGEEFEEGVPTAASPDQVGGTPFA
jgi:hypothetical protein